MTLSFGHRQQPPRSCSYVVCREFKTYIVQKTQNRAHAAQENYYLDGGSGESTERATIVPLPARGIALSPGREAIIALHCTAHFIVFR